MDKIQTIKSLPQEEILKKVERIKPVFIGVPIIAGPDGYPYSLFSLTDFYPPLTADVVEDMADIMVYYGQFENADILVSEADRGGGPLVHAVAMRTGLPYTIANWYPAEIPGHIKVMASVGFSGEGAIYLNGMEPGMRAIIVDDLISSGGTALALIEAIEKAGATTVEALFVAEKVGRNGRVRIGTSFPTPIKTFVRFTATGETTQEFVPEDGHQDSLPYLT